MMAVVERRTKRGDAVPWWDNRPHPFDDLAWILEAYDELATCKQVGFGEGPLPWGAVDRWCERYGMTLEEQEEFLVYLRAIDTEMCKPDPKKA